MRNSDNAGLIAPLRKYGLPTVVAIAGLALTAAPSLAHHPMGGATPATFFEGFMSGVGHPILGVDHLAFVVAIGLFAAMKRQGFLIPVAFVLTAMLGTAAHLMSATLPGAELWVAGSVLALGLLMLLQDRLNLAAISGLVGLAGLFHGYAYGEAIFGAEMTPLVAYLAGFTAIQLAIALFTAQVARMTMTESLAKFRSAGFVVVGIGFSLFASQVLSVAFPG
ncbi:HupE/UreJ family protein [filamentous cyanobacterium LEGE 11480]|uniref:HupE/UreJ family protein n=1 Tax=Romeriopsis navalis LEGE 11480 TaxID=2777977 RepID=A0A928VHB2_9CYAN|nr:HupE/UreJ family protein [Romeriopsis navalis]MBE9028603.1 HupE/UreJ family protein [Romeriopsis navalis LEGE 11480]